MFWRMNSHVLKDERACSEGWTRMFWRMNSHVLKDELECSEGWNRMFWRMNSHVLKDGSHSLENVLAKSQVWTQHLMTLIYYVTVRGTRSNTKHFSLNLCFSYKSLKGQTLTMGDFTLGIFVLCESIKFSHIFSASQ